MIAYFVLTDSSSFFHDCNPALVQGNFSWYKLRADLKAKEITIQTRVFFSMSLSVLYRNMEISQNQGICLVFSSICSFLSILKRGLLSTLSNEKLSLAD